MFCLQHNQCREPLISHKVPNRPWVKVRTDLFVIKNQINMVTVIYTTTQISLKWIGREIAHPVQDSNQGPNDTILWTWHPRGPNFRQWPAIFITGV